jgi:hypothetical protein
MAALSLDFMYSFAPTDESDGGFSGKPRQKRHPEISDDLPYRVELWNETRTELALVIAVTASGSIGFAAYHAATREFPDRYIVLRHHDMVLARWNGPTH